MKLPNRDYPVEVTEPQKRILDLKNVIKDMRRKRQDFIIARELKHKQYVIFRSFDEADELISFPVKKDRKRLKTPFIEYTLDKIAIRPKLKSYEIVS